MMSYESNCGLEEAGMAQMDDCIGEILKHLDDIGEADNPIVVFTTDNGAEVFTWPDGGITPFKGTKGTSYEGGFRAPAIIRWPGHGKPGSVSNGIMSALDWFPTLLAAAGNPDITDQLLKRAKLGDRTYKNHLDGYNQMAMLTGTGPSARHEFFYFSGPMLGALRVDDFKFQFLQQPYGWPGEKLTTDMPGIVNLRQDPFERTPAIRGETLNEFGAGFTNDFYAREFWRFVNIQQEVGKLAATAIDYPPMQDPASFTLEAIKAQIQKTIAAHEGQSSTSNPAPGSQESAHFNSHSRKGDIGHSMAAALQGWRAREQLKHFPCSGTGWSNALAVHLPIARTAASASGKKNALDAKARSQGAVS